MIVPATDGFVLGIDAGATELKGAILDYRGRVAVAERRPTHRERGATAVVETILDFAWDLVQQMPAGSDAGRVIAAGVAVPGIVDEDAGVARASVHLKWRNVPLRRLLHERLGLPVVIGHDARSASVAERLLGAARGCDNYLFLTLGTGVGAAVVVNGAPYVGVHGVGGEFAHMIVQPSGPRCACGHDGCVEALASASAVVRRYQAMAQSRAGITARDVAERAAAGEPVAMRVWRDAITALSTGIATYITLLDPARVIIGGGMAAAGPTLFTPLVKQLATEVRFQAVPPVLSAGLGEGAGYLGAALTAWFTLGVSRAEVAAWWEAAH